ncbi:hypothetical protein DNK47_02470 [Mycoplasma wenyonii]|uniref:Uncharacterized protein n=1 Tax=Mycoplasma wenyonii TaxID=65123 RepID=A0A328PIL2_9MOLU|nr:hypothetical protein [Mycoplasma wenyonii]RAO94913.1 hypothetical protein DNK47_02470 [Mycoplasma wenyonii]
MEKFLLKNGKEGDLYVGILCENTNVETDSGSLSYAWTGLFPSSLLASGDELAIGKKLDIKTKTVSKDEITTTTFESKVLKAPVAGTWKEKITNEGEFPITSISVSENTNIYLISY